LDSHELIVDLHHHALDPAADPLTFALVITEDLDTIADVEATVSAGCPHVVKLRDSR
jgi:hypothetical protein